MRIASRIVAGSLVCISTIACVTAPPVDPKDIDYGEEPVNFEVPIHRYFDDTLKDPSSIQYKEITKPEKGFYRAPLIAGGKVTHGWLVKATINAKNSYGGYVGFQTYRFLFRGENLVATIPPAVE